MEHEDLREAYDQLEERFESLQRLERAKYAVYATPVVVFGVILGGVFLSAGQTPAPDRKEFSPNLTDYQEEYVDCPHRHIYICTRMSRVGAEQVSYEDARDGRIYLRYSGSDRLVARMPQNGTKGYLINIDRGFYSTEDARTSSELPQSGEGGISESARDTNNTETRDVGSTESRNTSSTQADDANIGDATPTNMTQGPGLANRSLTSRNQTSSTQTS